MIKGWCPGVLQPMQTGDGLIARLRISGGIVDARLAAAIADWSGRFGNGQIDLTNRGNLQLRGLSKQHLPGLQNALSGWHLLDSDPASEAVRNVISSPLAGLDPNAVLDVRPIARGLEQRLAHDALLRDLPAKFAFLIDDGGKLGLDDVDADVRFVACQMPEGPAFTIGLGGISGSEIEPCPPDALIDVAIALARAFLQHRRGSGSAIRRMRDLVRMVGPKTIMREAGLAPGNPPRFGLRVTSPSAQLGAQPFGSLALLGIGLPFGRIAADDFAAMVSEAVKYGAQELRLSPWRTILVPLPSISAAYALSARLPQERLILASSDMRVRVAACPGAPSCSEASTWIRNDAAVLTDTMQGMAGCGTVLHVSGCKKGCAHPRPAAITLVAEAGRYNLVLNGMASDAPLCCKLTLDQAVQQVRKLVASQLQRGVA